MKIAIINTGGTISCVGDPLAPMTASQFAAASEQILKPILAQSFPSLEIDYITDLTFPESKSGTLDSTNLQPTDWCILAGYILDHYTLYDGWVVLHGTDSMDFTGTALPFLLSCFTSNGIATAALSKPVIITGSQVPMFWEDPKTGALSLNFNTDAYQNFCGAVASAQTGIPEVCVYFQSELYRGNRVLKTNASKFDAFSSPNYPALGAYGIEFTLEAGNVLPSPHAGAPGHAERREPRLLQPVQHGDVGDQYRRQPRRVVHADPRRLREQWELVVGGLQLLRGDGEPDAVHATGRAGRTGSVRSQDCPVRGAPH